MSLQGLSKSLPSMWMAASPGAVVPGIVTVTEKEPSVAAVVVPRSTGGWRPMVANVIEYVRGCP